MFQQARLSRYALLESLISDPSFIINKMLCSWQCSCGATLQWFSQIQGECHKDGGHLHQRMILRFNHCH
jgi:hypothetical protein